MKKRTRIPSFFLAVLLMSSLILPANAAENAMGTTLRLEETKGTVTVATSSGTSKSVIAGMRLYNGYNVRTGASSEAYIGLDETKAVMLDSSGKVEIKKSGKKLEVSLVTGELFFDVAKPLESSESLNIRTSTMVTGIRGSFGWVTPDMVGLIHGHVTLTCTNPETNETRVTEIYSGEIVTYDPESGETNVNRTLKEIDFIKEEMKPEDVPVFVVEEIAKKPRLQDEMNKDDAALNYSDLLVDFEQRQAEALSAEQAAVDSYQKELSNLETQTAKTAAADYAASESSSAPSGGSSSGGSSSSGSSKSTSPTTTGDAAQLQTLLNSYTDVTFTGDNADSALSGLTIASDATLRISGGSASLRVNNLNNSGHINVESGSNTLTTGAASSNSGTISIYGSMTNTAGGTLTNTGVMLVESGGLLTNAGTIDNSSTSGSLSVTGTLTNTGTIKN